MLYYIAGPMSGLPGYNRRAFDAAERMLRRDGHLVLNPAVLPTDLPYKTYLPICLTMLQQCDVVLLLHGWELSRGARLEAEFAKTQGKILIEKEDYL